VPINWRTDYGIRLVYELACMGVGVRATVRNISEASGVPYDYARTIVRDLVGAGVMSSRRGVGGGVEITRPHDEITILEIFRALDEPPTLALCTDAGGICARTETCPMHVSIWNDLDRLIVDYLGSMTIAKAVELGLPLRRAADTGC